MAHLAARLSPLAIHLPTTISEHRFLLSLVTLRPPCAVLSKNRSHYFKFAQYLNQLFVGKSGESPALFLHCVRICTNNANLYYKIAKGHLRNLSRHLAALHILELFTVTRPQPWLISVLHSNVEAQSSGINHQTLFIRILWYNRTARIAIHIVAIKNASILSQIIALCFRQDNGSKLITRRY
jgi:hypothetical protein